MALIVRTVKGRTEPLWRCGVRHTREGTAFEEDAFTDAQWKRIMDDPLLETEAAGTADAEMTPELIERIAGVIAALPEDAFTQAGPPKLDPLRKALPEDAAAITDPARDKGYALFDQRRKDAAKQAKDRKPAS